MAMRMKGTISKLGSLPNSPERSQSSFGFQRSSVELDAKKNVELPIKCSTMKLLKSPTPSLYRGNSEVNHK